MPGTPACSPRFLARRTARGPPLPSTLTTEGTFEHGLSVLQLLDDPDDADRHQRVRTRLFEARRDQRTAPGRDDKAVAAWNGLAVAALAEAGVLTDRPELVDAARQTADMLERVHWDDKAARLTRTSRDGVAGHQNLGVLEDYADVAEGLLALYAVTGETRWYRFAGKLLDVVLDEFRGDDGLFYDTAVHGEALIFRPADPTDNATPGGTSAAAGALLTYAALTGSGRHREAAEQALHFTGALADGHRGSRAGAWPSPKRWRTARAKWRSSARAATPGPAACARCTAPRWLPRHRASSSRSPRRSMRTPAKARPLMRGSLVCRPLM